jgi:hypothetical protein
VPEVGSGAGFRHYLPPSRACKPGDNHEPRGVIDSGSGGMTAWAFASAAACTGCPLCGLPNRHSDRVHSSCTQFEQREPALNIGFSPLDRPASLRVYNRALAPEGLFSSTCGTGVCCASVALLATSTPIDADAAASSSSNARRE